MFFPQEALNRLHPTSAMCRIGTERKQLRLVVEKTEDHMGRLFLEYFTPLTAVFSFQYLGKTLLSTNDNWPAVERNLWR